MHMGEATNANYGITGSQSILRVEAELGSLIELELILKLEKSQV